MYKPGDWNAVCDHCGMTRKASQFRKDWQGFMVCEGCFNTRHPQDFVKGIPENQSVPIARPDTIASMGETTVDTTGLRNATSIVLTSVAGISSGDSLGIVLDNGSVHWTYSDGDPVGTTVTLGSYLPGQATAGNVVYLPSINNEIFVTAAEVTATDL